LKGLKVIIFLEYDEVKGYIIFKTKKLAKKKKRKERLEHRILKCAVRI
jgi:hypothetical protein